jgi:hypothetical protein
LYGSETSGMRKISRQFSCSGAISHQRLALIPSIDINLLSFCPLQVSEGYAYINA